MKEYSCYSMVSLDGGPFSILDPKARLRAGNRTTFAPAGSGAGTATGRASGLSALARPVRGL